MKKEQKEAFDELLKRAKKKGRITNEDVIASLKTGENEYLHDTLIAVGIELPHNTGRSQAIDESQKLHMMHLSHLPFEKIKSGTKKMEIRLCDEKRKRLKVNDYIVFSDLSDKNSVITVKIRGLHRFDSFLELFQSINPELCGNDENTSPEEAAEGMREYYTEEKEKAFGVLAIKIEIMKS